MSRTTGKNVELSETRKVQLTTTTFGKPILTAKMLDKELLKVLIANAISERLVQNENVRLGVSRLASHLSVMFI